MSSLWEWRHLVRHLVASRHSKRKRPHLRLMCIFAQKCLCLRSPTIDTTDPPSGNINLSLKSQSCRQKDVSGEIVPCATAEKAKGSSWQGSRDKCQQYSKSVNVKTFDQSEHVTSIWYHGLAASKACLQVSPLPFPFPIAFNFLYLLLYLLLPTKRILVPG